jgi:hypothetical protein
MAVLLEDMIDVYTKMKKMHWNVRCVIVWFRMIFDSLKV